MLTQQENILYINQFAFRTTSATVEIHFHPKINKFELYAFEICTAECLTATTAKVIDEIGEYCIREWNETLFFQTDNNSLLGAKLDCKGTYGPEDEPWINVYNFEHIEGEDFSIAIKDLKKDKIKLAIKGFADENHIQFEGWLPLELTNPTVWVKDFFAELKSKKEFITYFHYFNKYNIDQSPEWKKYTGNYEERIILIAKEFGFTAIIDGTTKSGQRQWKIKNNN